jgi:hypothetical protein
MLTLQITLAEPCSASVKIALNLNRYPARRATRLFEKRSLKRMRDRATCPMKEVRCKWKRRAQTVHMNGSGSRSGLARTGGAPDPRVLTFGGAIR